MKPIYEMVVPPLANQLRNLLNLTRKRLRRGNLYQSLKLSKSMLHGRTAGFVGDGRHLFNISLCD